MEEETEKKIQWYFSLFSGKIYYADADENLDVFQIPLKEKPSDTYNCTSCYGRSYTDYNPTQKHFTPCTRCLKKFADLEKMKLIKNG